MSSNIESAFATLLAEYGTHTHAAKCLGFTPEHYRVLRNGHANIPKRTAALIILKAQEVEACRRKRERMDA